MTAAAPPEKMMPKSDDVALLVDVVRQSCAFDGRYWTIPDFEALASSILAHLPDLEAARRLAPRVGDEGWRKLDDAAKSGRTFAGFWGWHDPDNTKNAAALHPFKFENGEWLCWGADAWDKLASPPTYYQPMPEEYTLHWPSSAPPAASADELEAHILTFFPDNPHSAKACALTYHKRAQGVGEMRGALRLYAITNCRGPYLDNRQWNACTLCGESWASGEPEIHATNCLSERPRA